jgi:hypothetical protein
MSYLNQFVESIRFLGELEPEFFLNESAANFGVVRPLISV